MWQNFFAYFFFLEDVQNDLGINFLIYLFFLFCRIQKELADITLDPPPNCRFVQ